MSQINDGRKRVRRTLLPLTEACANFKGFAKGENRSERIIDLLTPVIQRVRRVTPQPFYAMRDVSAFFGISVTTVARVYRQLEREGILTLVRSSQTMIAPRAPRTRFAVRGVVCMPIWLPGFMQFLDWRKWFSQLQEELSRYRFVLEPIFYRQNEDDLDFVDRILQFNPDYLLWNYPVRSDEMIIQSIADTGVSVVTIQSTDEPVSIASRVYWQSTGRGLKQGLREWQAEGEVDRIIIPQQDPGDISASKSFAAALAACPLPHEYKTFPGTDELGANFSPVQDFLRSLTRNSRTGIIFRDDLFHARLCAWLPDAMLELFRRHRVMVLRQVFLPSLRAPSEVTVDLLQHPTKQLARRIASDLNKGLPESSFQKIVFEAEWRPKTPLGDVVHRLLAE